MAERHSARATPLLFKEGWTRHQEKHRAASFDGADGLVYEVVWTRLFTVVIGNTVFSVSAVLSVFMGGLALGSRLAGGFLDRRPIPLVRTYAVLEGGVGVYNLLLPLFLKAADPVSGL